MEIFGIIMAFFLAIFFPRAVFACVMCGLVFNGVIFTEQQDFMGVVFIICAIVGFIFDLYSCICIGAVEADRS